MSDGNTSATVEVSPDAVDGGQVTILRLEALRPSQTHVQAERRKRFDVQALKELTTTIREVGVLEPILVRPLDPEPGATWEIVAGERRWCAAKQAGLSSIRAIVRDLSDEQVLHLQRIENVQREQLHPLDEAVGFEELLKQHGYTVDRLAAKVHKARGYIYAQLKLLALCPAARRAFSDGKLTTATAFRLALVPVEALQKEALKEILNGRHGGEPMTEREVARHLQTKYMLRLADASFPRQDADLVKAAGPCGTCPKRTGSQPELFKDVQGADVCTDPLCFQSKRVAFRERQLASAQEAGRTVIQGAAAKKIAPYGAHHLEGYVRPTDRCSEDKKNRTYRQLIGDKVATSLVLLPEDGDLIEVMDCKAIEAVLKERGIQAQGGTMQDSDRARRAKVKAETAFRYRLFEAVRAKSPAALARGDWEQIALTGFGRHGFDARKRLLQVWGWDEKQGKGYDGLHHDQAARSRIPKLSDAELMRFLLDCVYVSELQVSGWSEGKPDRLLGAAQKLKVNVEAIRKDLTAQMKLKADRKGKAPSPSTGLGRSVRKAKRQAA